MKLSAEVKLNFELPEGTSVKDAQVRIRADLVRGDDVLSSYKSCSSVELHRVSEVLPIRVVTACYTAKGAPIFSHCIVRCTPKDIESGEHYRVASKFAETLGYCPNFVHFAQDDMPSWLSERFSWPLAEILMSESLQCLADDVVQTLNSVREIFNI